jgi:hypothetical protein
MLTMDLSPSFKAHSAENPGGTSIEGENCCMAVIPLRNNAETTPRLHQI